MDADRLRSYLLTLPHVVETVQWSGRLVFWVGDKAIGGKMFAVLNLEPRGGHVISFAAGPLAFNELLELEGLDPAPYLARSHWVAAQRWDVFRPSEWAPHLQHAHALTLAKLPARTRSVLALPARQQRLVVAERRRALAAK